MFKTYSIHYKTIDKSLGLIYINHRNFNYCIINNIIYNNYNILQSNYYNSEIIICICSNIIIKLKKVSYIVKMDQLI